MQLRPAASGAFGITFSTAGTFGWDSIAANQRRLHTMSDNKVEPTELSSGAVRERVEEPSKEATLHENLCAFENWFAGLLVQAEEGNQR
jgi:hypothetical protein